MIAGVLLVMAALFAMAITPVVRAAATHFDVVDAPGPRKIHDTVMPRLGGLAVVLAAAGALGIIRLFASPEVWALISPGPRLGPVLGGAALVFVAGVWDDIRRAPVWAKVVIEALAAALAIGAGVTIDHLTIGGKTFALGVFAAPITLLWIVTVTNAFNLIDGLDGLSAGLSVIAAATSAAVLLARGFLPEAILLIALVGALVGFLVYNFPPATIFLGDGGSLPIGFLLGVSAITGWQKSTVALAAAVPLLILALPILDVMASIARRVGAPSTPVGAESPAVAPLHLHRSLRASVARVFQADQRHIHHRLLGFGLSQRAAVLCLYAVALLLSGIALLTFKAV